MRFSVITGIYNGDLTQLKEAVQSVLSQSLQNFEWIICDDGSRSEIRDYLKKLSAQESRIILLKNTENRGLAYSLNRCIAAASTDILVRQDGDDRSAPGRFEKLVTFMEQNPEYALVSSNIALFDQEGIWGKMIYPEYPSKRDFLFCLPFMHGAVALRREALVRHGAYLVSKETRRCEDFELFSRLYIKGEKGYTIQEELYEYREDAYNQQKRKYRFRFDEAGVRWKAFKSLGLLPQGIPYAIKPLIVGLLPKGLLNKLKDHYYNRRG